MQTTTKENVSSNKVLLASREDLFSLLSFLDTQLPQNCPIHSFVLSAINSHSSAYKVYYVTQNGDHQPIKAHYRAILALRYEHLPKSKNYVQSKSWMVSAWQESDPVELCKIFDTLSEINWCLDRLTWVGNGEVPNHAVLKHIEQHKATKLEPRKNGSPCLQYYLPIEEAIAQKLDTPKEVYVKSLERTHAAIVYESWAHKDTATVEDVALGIDQLPSAGVFLKENDQLVSWMVSYPPNGMSRLHTLDEHRRKGYAKLLTQYLAKRVAQSGYVPFANILQHNAPSITFFESMGFRFLCRRFVYVSDQISQNLPP